MNNGFSIINSIGENLTTKEYITNPAIARENEIKKLMIVLLTPEKSGLLVGKPGIGKTAIVEGLAYLIQKNMVPEVLKGYQIIKVNSSSLMNKVTINGNENLIINKLIEELKNMNKVILFIDEIHTLVSSNNESPIDIANILKPCLDRGDIKAIGATTNIEYETYVVRDRAFLRRFDRIDITEPDEPTTVKILYESLPKLEKKTGIKFKYNSYIVTMLLESIVSATSEYKRIYGLSAMYPDVSLSVLSQAFSLALVENRNSVTILDVYNAIKISKRIYPDSIIKELEAFREKFAKYCTEEGIILQAVTINDIDTNSEIG
ncbi:MAG: ATP-dependent Clp protease ATP-binding subunit [Bacilli bacterium]|nr:ATP-dependent Clp protease ATP-binding subunit [Bacilli bacterium]